MNRFIWKIRYTIEMCRVAKTPISLAWYCAEVGSEWMTEMSPSEAVREELSCWGD